MAPPFRRVLDAEIVVAPQLDTDELGTFSGEVPRPDALVETCAIKAELAFRSLDVDCAIANEGSYGPIDAVPLVPSGVEIMAFLDRKRGIRIIETLSDASHQLAPAALQGGRSQHRQGGEGDRLPALRRVRAVQQRHGPSDQERAGHPGRRRLGDEPGGQALRGRHGGADRRHARPSQSHAHARAARAVVAARQAAGASLPEMRCAGLRQIGNRRGLPCEGCAKPTHWVHFEIDGCSVCGHAETRPRKDGRKTAAKLSCASCSPRP